jgi:DNA-binding MarR family transcriptional regulator
MNSRSAQAVQRPDHRTQEIASLLHDRFARLSRQMRNIELPDGMTPERLSALMVIEKHGPISVTALAGRELVRPATMSRMVTALVNDGLARRHEDKDDGRGVLITVTARGRRCYRKANEQRLELMRRALGELDRDQLSAMQGLAAALERLSSVLDTRKLPSA